MSDQEKAEIKRLIADARSGSEIAFDRLIGMYSPLVTSLVTKYSQIINPDDPEDTDDMRQEALIIFCNAVMKYDPEQNGVEFGLFAKICMERGLISLLRSTSKRIRPDLGDDSISEIVIYDDPSEKLIESENVREMWRLINEKLSDYENKVFNLHLSGASVAKIAEVLGKDEKSINNALCRIRKKLGEAIKSRLN